MSTQTQPAARDAGEPTAIVASDKATALAALAWSDADDDETVEFDADRTTFWLRLYAGTTAALVLILGIVLWFVLSSHHQPGQEPVAVPASTAPDVVAAPAPSGPDDRVVPSPAAPAPAPPSIAAPPPEPTSTVTVTQTPAPVAQPLDPVPAVPPRSGTDEAFIAALREDGIIITNPAEIVAGAHQACAYIAAGHTAHDTMRLAMAENSTLTPENASTLIGAAIGAYCPQYGG
jgi:Protein of unknown function (DUF732)